MTNQLLTLTLNSPTLDSLLTQLKESATTSEHVLAWILIMQFLQIGVAIFIYLRLTWNIKQETTNKYESKSGPDVA